jgi:hypothetical protein
MRLACLVLVLLGACASPPQLWPQPNSFDSAPLWPLYWSDDSTAYGEALQQAAWESSGSIQAERLRQSYSIQSGNRLQEFQRADDRAKKFPADPSAQYLRARLMQDPVRLAGEFQQLAQRWPQHAWIQLGAAGSLQNVGRYRQAAAHLNAAPDWADAREFRLLLLARQAMAQNHAKPWLPLMALAFDVGSPNALYEVQQLAINKRDSNLQKLCRAELNLRQGAQEEESKRLDYLLNRALAELESDRVADIPELLGKMDGWSELLGLPSDWSSAHRYELPGGLGMLVPPELHAQQWAQLLERHQTAVMMGQSVATAPAMLVLRKVERRELDWPGLDQPVELVLAESGHSNQQTYFAGAALFRGFYARRDLANAQAAGIYARLQRLHDEGITLQKISQGVNGPEKSFRNPLPEESKWLPPGQSLTLEMDRGSQDVGRLPEDMDLPLRLRLIETWDAALQGPDALKARVQELEWQNLVLHESGHLPDILPWTQGKGGIWEALGMGLQSILRDGMLLGEWEYRAQLRAFASGHLSRWTLAEIVEIARSPQHPYYKPYRRLLGDMVQLTRKMENWPSLPNWTSLEEAEWTIIQRAMLKQARIERLPSSYVTQLSADWN